MRGSSAPLPSGAGAVDRTALEDVLRRFEAAWGAGPPPVIDDFRTGSAVQSPALLVELVQLDLEFRLRAGEAVRVESYLTRYPQLAEDPSAVRELIAAEYRLRR